MSEDTNIHNAIMNAFEEYKKVNDARLAQIESKGSADPLTEQKLARIDAALNDLDAEVKNVAKKAGRVAANEEKSEAEYEAKFNAWARTGDGEREIKSLSGVSVPKLIDSAVISQLTAVSAMRNLANVIRVSTPDAHMLLNDANTASGWVSETAARTETGTPTITDLTIPMGELYANPGVSQNALDDAVFNVDAFLTNEIAKAFGVAEGAAFINGNGTNKPKGILASGTGIASATSANVGALAGDDILSLVYSLASGHRAGAVFVMNNATQAKVRELKDSYGQYLWQPGLVAGQPATLAGHAVHEDANMPDVATGNKAIAFGNFQNGYVIADRAGITLLRDPYTNKPYVMFYATKRVGGRVVDPQAIKLLAIG